MGAKNMDLTWEEKLQIFQKIEYDNYLHFRKPGDWYCSFPGEVSDGAILTSWYQDGSTPEEAVNKAWEKFVSLPDDCHIRLHNGSRVQYVPGIGVIPFSG